ncbi:MAG: phosphoribosyl-ATP diphosphatase [bacterium]|nr:phosphoribosyl-ATP diphosphatase [bacterium]
MLEDIFEIIKTRKKEADESSYTHRLLKEGTDRVAQKVGEEAVEVVIAAKNDDPRRLISEMADLWYHCLVLLAEQGLTPKHIYDELEARHNARNKPDQNRDSK